jgi:hypothetical protein
MQCDWEGHPSAYKDAAKVFQAVQAFGTHTEHYDRACELHSQALPARPL